MKFQWDPKKENINIQKHGVNFEQASYVFADPNALSIFDEDHSDCEDRWILLGKSLNEIVLTVVHTYRNEDDIEIVRIISARKASKHEVKTYQGRKAK